MSIAVPAVQHLSREEFYRWAEQQPRGRFERIDGCVVAMAPEKGAHLRMKAAIWLALHNAIQNAGSACQALPDGVTIAAGDNDYEPDAVVNCGPRMDDDAIAAPNPVVVVEVLSPSTAGTDTGAKLAGYFLVPSILHYLIVHPTRRQVIHHRRRINEAGIDTAILASGTLHLDPPGLAIDLAALYASVD
jgi:Uma2 family endonuclease